MEVRFLTAGDRAVSVEFGKTICLETNAKVRMLDENLKEDPIEGMIETVPTYCALIIHYRPEVIRYGKLVKELEKRLGNMHAVDNSNKKKVVKEVPVYYGGETGPDLEYCAELEHTTVEEIIRKHSEHEYYVYMLGFAPGHPYMARFDEPFGFKRRESPRVKIPARSIVVQQNLSDFIPFEQPCGWNIIGSTPLDICNFDNEDPFLVHAGDWVKHVPVTKSEYDKIRSGETGPDLEYCAELEHTTVEEIIRKHSEHEYYVYMLGFAPGHPYMARFDEPFGFKRRESPRVKIPARSIVVQQNLSDFIPFEQPCGWNIIGSTPLDICNFDNEDPFLVHAGDWVKHVPVTKSEYDKIRRDVEKGTYKVKTYTPEGNA